MTILVYNDNNTEGAHSTSFDFRDTEIRKGDKIVATDLVDLYDVELTNLQDKEILVYNSTSEKWVNGEPSSGSECVVENVDVEYTIGNEGDFLSIKDCFDHLRETCVIISEYNIVTVKLLDNQTISESVSLNHLYGHRIILDLNGFTISGTFTENGLGNLDVSYCHSIKEITNGTMNDAGLTIRNNSSTTITDITPVDLIVSVENNSYIESDDIDEIYMRNCSTLKTFPTTNMSHNIVNGCTILSNDTTKFDTTTFTNSELILYK